MKTLAIAAGALALTLVAADPASALDKLRVGNPSPVAFSFVPMDIGMQKGIFAKHGLDIEYVGFAGSAKIQQAMIADAIDISVSAGPEFHFVVKGAPEIGIAAMAGPPLLLTLIVLKDSPYQTAKDLKGIKVAVSTAGGLTDWLPRELSRQQGWGPNDIEPVAIGSTQAMLASLKNKQTQGLMSGINQAWDLEAAGQTRTIVKFGDIVPDFIMHVIYATNKIAEKNPDAVRRYLAAWFETIKYMRENKDETVKIATPIIHSSPEITAKTYDYLMPMFSDTGKFEPKAVKVLARSFVDMGNLETEPDLSKYYTEKFLPGAASTN
jgi:NitT/TauT family transport system substrate-binding protein